MNTSNCYVIDVETFDWIYWWAGVAWFLTGYFCAKCVVKTGEYIDREDDDVLTAQPVSVQGES